MLFTMLAGRYPFARPDDDKLPPGMQLQATLQVPAEGGRAGGAGWGGGESGVRACAACSVVSGGWAGVEGLQCTLSARGWALQLRLLLTRQYAH